MMMAYKLILFFCLYSMSFSKDVEYSNISDSWFLKYKFFDNNLFYIENRNDVGCERMFYNYDYGKNKLDSFEIELPLVGKYNCERSKDYIKDFEINDSILIIFYNYYIFFYNKSGNSYIFNKFIDLKVKIYREGIDKRVGTRIILKDSLLIGFQDSYLSTDFAKNYLFAWKFNLCNEVVDTFKFNEPTGYQWTLLQPKEILDYYQGTFVFSDVDDDNIYLYKDRIQKIDLNIFMNKKQFISDTLKYHSTGSFFSMNQGLIDSIYLIHKVSFLDSENILIAYSIPNLNFENKIHVFRYCLLIFNSNQWEVLPIENTDKIFGLIDNYSYGVFYEISNGMLISNHINSKNNFIRIEKINDIIQRIRKK